ncbi:tRNA (N(6)-L-threonylcarbamoyladenosine(37)-C(2))-methylthiotransferase MtaB [Yunchengibacter salinarum]|uniref:tRNA (N(6)-L-threonylcarbamoyladenosine(37)-C(2))- methylthiotransferase MtaB n=1 Tax=Yunchengibacter salinarum TaxID=3133399 RepID=UPI0035B60346
MSSTPTQQDAEIVTFGCRLNAYESEVMAGHASRTGLDNTVIFNTCAVTAEAARQARQAIRRTHRERPDARIIVTGCAAQVDPASFADMPEVSHVIGNQEKLSEAPFRDLKADRLERVRVNDIMSVRETAGHMIESFGDRARAFVQIQNGCNHRCTFCIIPYGRGNSRSVPMGGVVDQIKALVDQGFGEVVLTGVDLTSYGEDLPGTPTLGTLVQKILSLVPGLQRLRISSIDSIEVDDALMDAITGDPRLMPHLHLSLQAGDNMILKRMKRRHLREDAIRFCETVRARRPEITFGADIIAGFPTETEEMFENSLKLVEDCGLTWLHVFPYSAREGTPAARMPQLPGDVRKARAARLRALGDARVADLFSAAHGANARVLVERIADDGSATGHDERFIPVHIPSGARAAGDILPVRLADTGPNAMTGTPIDP